MNHEEMIWMRPPADLETRRQISASEVTLYMTQGWLHADPPAACAPAEPTDQAPADQVEPDAETLEERAAVSDSNQSIDREGPQSASRPEKQPRGRKARQ